MSVPTSRSVEDREQTARIGARLAPTGATDGLGRRLRAAVGRAVPWLGLVVLTVVILEASGTPLSDIARYGAYWIAGVVLPGTLVWRACVGSLGNWPEDLTAGAVTGLGLELAAWALLTGLGLQQWIWVWSAVVAAVFLGVPRLRKHWRIVGPRPLPPAWSWGVATAIGVVFAYLSATYLSSWELPPEGTVYYNDLLWHLSIVHELTRALPPDIPQVVGEPFRYHWFSHAHMASASLVSGVPEATVLLRLWLLPMVALAALSAAALAREVSRVWWAGPVAAWAAVALPGVNLLPATAISMYTVIGLSPSHIYIVPIVLVAAVFVVRILRGQRVLLASWFVLCLLIVLAAGAKPTGLPLMGCATSVSAVPLVLMRRREWRSAAGLTLLITAVFLLSRLFVAGSDNPAWTRVGLFAYAEWLPFYADLTGEGRTPVAGPLLPDGISDWSVRSIGVLGLLLILMLAGHVGRLAPFAVMATGRFRRDPVAWWFAGFVAAAWGVFLTFSHVALSQAYFLHLSVPVAGVFLAWALTWAAGRTVNRRISLITMALGVGLGAGVVWLARWATPAIAPDETTSVTVRAVSFAVPLAIGCGSILVGWVVLSLVRRSGPALAGVGTLLLLAAVGVGAQLENSINVGRATVQAALTDPASEPAGSRIEPEVPAALYWLGNHSDVEDVVATNLHCVPVVTVPDCVALSFWVSGLGGRRTMLEGWGYTGQVEAFTSPSPWPDRLVLNDQAFAAPTPDILDELRGGYGVRWLVAHREAGPVSSDLDRLATLRYAEGPVSIYELR